MEEMAGIYEIAQIAKVSPSAVANWRTRFLDFPLPAFELKAGPVFRMAQVQLWLSQRREHVTARIPMYDRMAGIREDSTSLVESVRETVAKMQKEGTTSSRPGMLLGRIQSGKTRAFLGVIAHSFDIGYDVAVILTKGTKSLAKQTLSRVKQDFSEFIEDDQVQAYDVMFVPKLSTFDLNHKLILVTKKEDDNLDRLLDMFQNKYPSLGSKRLLIVDDEADLASNSFRKKNGVAQPGVISNQIDRLREIVSECSFLQVTATPYALYLQPESGPDTSEGKLFLPKRPAFTVLLPTHSGYVGGDQYFRDSNEEGSAASYLFHEVPLSELDALRQPDRRRLKVENALTEKNAEVLRDAIVSFIVGGTIRRLQQAALAERQEKYSFLFHTEQKRSSHDWQQAVAEAIQVQLAAHANTSSPLYHQLVTKAYFDLKRSSVSQSISFPTVDEVTLGTTDVLTTGQLMVNIVNSDQDIDRLLDSEGQLHLRNPFNIFIGGQILDRGITIKNLIGFYYGRNPKTFQQDTVLQHSRMYGARSSQDLCVTRFFAPLHIYRVMRKINDFDSALREGFEDKTNNRAIYFIERDTADNLIPCAPNKLMFSKLTSVRPGKRMLPVGFQTLAPTVGRKALKQLDARLEQLCPADDDSAIIDVSLAKELLTLVYANLEFEAGAEDESKAQAAILEHLAEAVRDQELKGKIFLLAARDRDTSRYRDSGRLSDAPDTKQQAAKAAQEAGDSPVLMLLRQNGREAMGWRDLPFWWPVVLVPKKAVTAVFTIN